MSEIGRRFLAKATANLDAAESEFAAGRYDGCANRCYYACFQAAIAALYDAGVLLSDRRGHDQVQAKFAGELVNRRHMYAPELRDVLPILFSLRQQADYEPEPVTFKHAERAMRRMRGFLRTVNERIGP
jgi:uncharacterized protein (UPF0332 family)